MVTAAAKRRRRIGQWLWFEPVYRVNYALLSCAPEQAARRIRRVLPADVCDELDKDGVLGTLNSCFGRFIAQKHDTSGTIATIWISPKADVSVVAHEAFHAVSFLLKGSGLSVDSASEEAYAYLLEWLVREILKRMERQAI